MLREVLASGIQLGMNESIGDAWIGLGRTASAAESWADAELAFGEALLRAEQGSEPEQEAVARAHRAAAFVAQGRFADAAAEAEEALRLVEVHSLSSDSIGSMRADPRVADWAHAAQRRAEAHSAHAVRWFGARSHLDDGDASMLRLRADVLERADQVDGARAIRVAAAERIAASAAALREPAWAERFRRDIPDHRALLGVT